MNGTTRSAWVTPQLVSLRSIKGADVATTGNCVNEYTDNFKQFGPSPQLT